MYILTQINEKFNIKEQEFKCRSVKSGYILVKPMPLAEGMGELIIKF